ncbi:MAG: class I SAM-dependent methyltransferase [Aquamicrobium sp.]|uniref:class I SAM-dependent methyltransferase n=1 Tax=Aquamicrobium sp. TaxID=1872579 RepID=UPI00349EC559|nr:class I SAM-dependent methyltransferase [Aquamicrobium sp.]
MDRTLDHGALMDRVYRWQRRFGFYDLTRKYYLLARDPMIAGLAPPPGGAMLEIGCGTGRNLVRAARLYPGVALHGIDISREMLTAAGAAVERNGLRGRVRLALADAAGFDPATTFGRENYDRIFISYAVSMIPQWRAVVEAAARRLAPGGALHIADFGDMAALPAWSRAAMHTWLRWYHVTPRPDLFAVAGEVADAVGGTSEERRLHRGFSWIGIVMKPDI